MRGCAWLALAAVRTVAAARRGSAHALGTATGCPPAGFDSVANFSLARYIAASPWYVIAQLPISFQPVSELYCVRATYVQANETIYVFNEARRGAVDGEPIAEADLVAHQDDLPEASANARTADSKLRVGLRYYAFVYQNSSAPHAQRAVASNLVSQMADDEERLGPDAKRRELLDFLKRYLFGPVRARGREDCAPKEGLRGDFVQHLDGAVHLPVDRIDAAVKFLGARRLAEAAEPKDRSDRVDRLGGRCHGLRAPMPHAAPPVRRGTRSQR